MTQGKQNFNLGQNLALGTEKLKQDFFNMLGVANLLKGASDLKPVSSEIEKFNPNLKPLPKTPTIRKDWGKDTTEPLKQKFKAENIAKEVPKTIKKNTEQDTEKINKITSLLNDTDLSPEERQIVQNKLKEIQDKNKAFDIQQGHQTIEENAKKAELGAFTTERLKQKTEKATGKQVALGQQLKVNPLLETGARIAGATGQLAGGTVAGLATLGHELDPLTQGTRLINAIAGKPLIKDVQAEILQKGNKNIAQGTENILNKILPQVGGQGYTQALGSEKTLGAEAQRLAPEILSYLAPSPISGAKVASKLSKLGKLPAFIGKEMVEGLAPSAGISLARQQEALNKGEIAQEQFLPKVLGETASLQAFNPLAAGMVKGLGKLYKAPIEEVAEKAMIAKQADLPITPPQIETPIAPKGVEIPNKPIVDYRAMAKTMEDSGLYEQANKFIKKAETQEKAYNEYLVRQGKAPKVETNLPKPELKAKEKAQQLAKQLEEPKIKPIEGIEEVKPVIKPAEEIKPLEEPKVKLEEQKIIPKKEIEVPKETKIKIIENLTGTKLSKEQAEDALKKGFNTEKTSNFLKKQQLLEKERLQSFLKKYDLSLNINNIEDIEKGIKNNIETLKKEIDSIPEEKIKLYENSYLKGETPYSYGETNYFNYKNSLKALEDFNVGKKEIESIFKNIKEKDEFIQLLESTKTPPAESKISPLKIEEGQNIPAPKIKEQLIEKGKKVFDLDEEKAIAHASVSEAIIKQIAKRSNKTPEEIFNQIEFKKGTLKELEEKKGLKFQEDENLLDNLNPTGSIFAKYTPEIRAKAKLAPNIKTLADTAEKNKDDLITIYRGVSGKQKEIQPGDFITTNKQLALDYGAKDVISKKVKYGDILDDLDEPLGEEYLYRPGAFEETRIKFQKTEATTRGALLEKDGKRVIYALTNPNVSTPLHEMAHVYEHVLTKPEKSTIENWAKAKIGTTDFSEKFARGFEKYLSEGVAPTKELKNIFESFKEWLTDIYKGIKGSEIDLELSPEMKKIYDEMLGKENKIISAPKIKERKFATSLKESSNVHPEIKKKISENPDLIYYEKKSNKETLTAVKKEINEKGLQESKNEFLAKENTALTDDDIFKGIETAKQLQKEGSIEEATEVFEKLVRAGTESGRTVQAFRSLSIIEDMNESTALYFKQKQITKNIPEHIQKAKDKISLKLKENIKRIRRVAGKKLTEEINKFCGF